MEGQSATARSSCLSFRAAGLWAPIRVARTRPWRGGSRARMGRRHFHRRHQFRDHRRQSARAARRAPAPAFWDLVSSRLILSPVVGDDHSRKIFNEVSAASGGDRRRARLLRAAISARRPQSARHASGPSASITQHRLRMTLEGAGRFRPTSTPGRRACSVGAVQVATGNLEVLRQREHEEIRPEHIMASGALPPGFPPIEIDGEAYWDGGIVSNTPLQYVLDWGWAARGHVRLPARSLQRQGPDAGDRCSTSRNGRRTSAIRAARGSTRTSSKSCRPCAVPSDGSRASCRTDVKSSLDWRLSSSLGCDAAITIVHLIHRRAAYSTQSNDYEFSRYTVDEHWRDGRADVERTLSHPSWINRERPTNGVAVLDLTKDLDPKRELESRRSSP